MKSVRIVLANDSPSVNAMNSHCLVISTKFYYAGCEGLTHTVIPLRLVDGTRAGLVTAAYFLGFVLGAYWGALFIRRVGHIRAFGSLLSLVVLAILVLPMTSGLWFWVAICMVHGASIAAVAPYLAAALPVMLGPVQTSLGFRMGNGFQEMKGVIRRLNRPRSS